MSLSQEAIPSQGVTTQLDGTDYREGPKGEISRLVPRAGRAWRADHRRAAALRREPGTSAHGLTRTWSPTWWTA